MSDLRHTVVALLLTTGSVALIAQDAPKRIEFDVVSIRRHDPNDFNGVMRTLPDGTFTMTGMAIDSIISTASPTQTRDVDGLPAWAKSEPYDVTAKPPAGATRDQIRQMWRAMFADRMKLSAHVEERVSVHREAAVGNAGSTVVLEDTSVEDQVGRVVS